MTDVTMKNLLEAGGHFGPQTSQWNPKMKPYIFGARNGIYIIDLQQTVKLFRDAYNFVRDLTAQGGQMLFVGTKKQAQDAIREEAERSGEFYVNQRWLGGMLTNFQTIQLRIRYMKDLEARKDRGELDLLPKKEAQKLTEELARLSRTLGGIRDMRRLPGAIFVVDAKKEHTAVTEARRLEIPVIALADTNTDPDLMDYPIPSNDDAIRAVRLLCAKIADAAVEGRRQHEARQKDREEDGRERAAGTEAPVTLEALGVEPGTDEATAAEAAPQEAAPQEAAPRETPAPPAVEEDAGSEQSAAETVSTQA